MGLAEPRRRTKIAHDPRNLAWTNSTDSYGHRLMQQQGWKAGDALGAKGRHKSYGDSEAAKVVVQYKDDNLGLGATLKSKDVANQRTGFDAFQGLLGRLNAKTEDEVKAVEKKLEDKKLAMFAQGRWGGMVFVPGGLLVQTDPFKQKIEAEKKAEEERQTMVEATDRDDSLELQKTTEKAQRKAEKQQRKEEKKLRKEKRRLEKEKKYGLLDSKAALPTPESSSSNEEETSEQRGQKRKISTVETPTGVTQPASALKNGRHILRGKNISAKRAAFADMKGLDEIFMRKA